MKELVTPRTLSGFRDLSQNDALSKSIMLHRLSQVFLSYGFMPIETPHLEHASILVKQGSEEIQKELYRFIDHGGRDVALRFDLTVPLARYVAQHRSEINLPFKRYAIGSVFRGERAQKGRYREFTQCDFDFIGSDSVSCDAEVIQVMHSALSTLGLKGFTIWINHRDILNGIFEYFGLSQNIESGLRIIDKLDKIGLDAVKLELQKELMLDEARANGICALISLKQSGSKEEFFQKTAHLRGYNDSLKRGLENLESTLSLLPQSMEQSSFCINFSIARGLGYYTGIVYESTIAGLESLGSVCSGGRYDHLTKNFIQENLSGVGASIGVDRLLVALLELGLLNRDNRNKILLIAMEASYLHLAHSIARDLRDQGLMVEVYPDITKLKKALSYANSKGHSFSLIIGESEYASKTVMLKNMTSGEQQQVAIEKVVNLIKN